MQAEFIKSAFKKSQYPPADEPEIAVTGPSNVGKSSLINVLLNRKKLARTSSTPGRTQSINFYRVDNRVVLVDLPGYGFARVPSRIKKTWKEMVETYLRSRPNLKAVIIILDIRRDPSPGDLALLEWLEHHGLPALPVLTKADKLSTHQAKHRSREIARLCGNISPEAFTLFSAKTGDGRATLWKKIVEAAEMPPEHTDPGG